MSGVLDHDDEANVLALPGYCSELDPVAWTLAERQIRCPPAPETPQCPKTPPTALTGQNSMPVKLIVYHHRLGFARQVAK